MLPVLDMPVIAFRTLIVVPDDALAAMTENHQYLYTLVLPCQISVTYGAHLHDCAVVEIELIALK